jgi:hypothetical protein
MVLRRLCCQEVKAVRLLRCCTSCVIILVKMLQKEERMVEEANNRRRNSFAAIWDRCKLYMTRLTGMQNKHQKHLRSPELSIPTSSSRQQEEEREVDDQQRARCSPRCATTYIRIKPCSTVTFAECLVCKMC